MAFVSKLSNLIGNGIRTPVTFAGSAGKNQLLDLATGTDLINQSLINILMTRIGTCYNNPLFGSNIWDLEFEPNNLVFRDLLIFGTTSAIQKWEKRITIVGVAYKSFLTDPNNPVFVGPEGRRTVYLLISYVINTTQTPGLLVFPFSRDVMSTEQLYAQSAIFAATIRH